jgi:hypothetical protein
MGYLLEKGFRQMVFPGPTVAGEPTGLDLLGAWRGEGSGEYSQGVSAHGGNPKGLMPLKGDCLANAVMAIHPPIPMGSDDQYRHLRWISDQCRAEPVQDHLRHPACHKTEVVVRLWTGRLRVEEVGFYF